MPYEKHEEGYKILEAYYKPGEFNDGRQKMIWMPRGANLILILPVVLRVSMLKMFFVLPGVPSILKSMLGGIKNKIVGGNPIISHTISLRTFESHIADFTDVQNKYQTLKLEVIHFFKLENLVFQLL